MQKKVSEELSFLVLNCCPIDVKNVYRSIDKINVKIEADTFHHSFNETCLNNSLLSVNPDTYICITG